MRFRFVYMGTKGDWVFLRSAFKMAVGFNCKRKCHLCDISEPGLHAARYWVAFFLGGLLNFAYPEIRIGGMSKEKSRLCRRGILPKIHSNADQLQPLDRCPVEMMLL